MRNALERIMAALDGSASDVVGLQSELTARVALGPENGGSGEHEKAAFVEQLFSKLRPDWLEVIKSPDERAKDGHRPSVIARWTGTEGGQTVWVLSHSDIVPPGDLSLWATDPFSVKVEGDRIIGRGVEDNQHGIVSSYLAIKAILDSGEPLPRSVGLAVVADEETGSRYGLDYVLNARGDLFGKADWIVVPDGGNEEGTMIEVAEKSMLWVRFTVTGKQCHASTPDKGKNSLVGAARLILGLAALRERFGDLDELFSPPASTFETTKMEANVPNVNTIPGKDVFYLDGRVLPRYALEDVLGACEEIARGVSHETGLDIQVEPVHVQPAPAPTSAEAPVVKALARAVKDVTGKESRPMGIGGGTVAAFFRKRGLPAAVWATVSETAHQPNEYCRISKVITDAKILARLYLDHQI
jgi:succinyl-diaminopimelate desuccinylase